ncbi:hypothetical protein VB773_18950 [Haloarculaceae archaeon H-GB2-1]|nr:hypothetical protein [Haloarculaceae archaeon H-GB2-1]
MRRRLVHAEARDVRDRNVVGRRRVDVDVVVAAPVPCDDREVRQLPQQWFCHGELVDDERVDLGDAFDDLLRFGDVE